MKMPSNVTRCNALLHVGSKNPVKRVFWLNTVNDSRNHVKRHLHVRFDVFFSLKTVFLNFKMKSIFAKKFRKHFTESSL